MSTPQDILSQILQGGLLDYSQPQVNSGLLGGNPNMNLGLSLLANSNTPGTFGALLGKSALETQQRQQNNAASQMQLLGSAQDLRMNMMQQQAMQEYMKRIAAGQQSGQPSQDPAQQQPQQTPQQFIPGISQMPPQQTAGMPQMGQPQAQVQTSQQPTMFGASSDIAATPINGMSPDMYRLYNAAMKKDPLETEKALRAAQVAAAQDQVRPQLDAADTIINSDRPSQYAKADPRVMAAWQQTAPRLGMNPLSDFSDDNVRRALNFARNEAASRVNLPVAKPPAPLQTQNGPLGSVYQKDPITGKLTQVRGEETLEDVDLGEGKHALLPTSQAAGKPKFNVSAAAAGSITDQAKELAYQKFVATGEMPTAGKGGAAVQASYANYFAKRAAEDGNTGAALAAKSQAFKASQGVLKDFESGATSKSIDGINTAIKHTAVLEPLVDALNNGDIQIINKAANFVKTQFGLSNAPNNFNLTRDFVAGEISKAVLPGGGGEREREEIASAAKSASNPGMLKDAIALWKQLLAGKTDSLRNRWDVGTAGTQGDFNKFLLPETKKALGVDAPAPVAGHPADIQALLNKYPKQ